MPISVLPLMLVVFSLTTGEFVMAGLLPDVAADLGVGVADAGLTITAYALGLIVGGPVVTALTARLARKPLIVGLVVVSVLGNLGSALAPGHPVLLASRFVAGLAVATFFAVAVATAAGLARPGRQAAAVAGVALGMNLGLVLGSPLGTALGHHLGWRSTFIAVAAASVLALLVVLRFVPPLPAVASGPVRAELRVFADRDLQLAIALTALGNVGVMTVYAYIAPLLVDVAGFTVADLPALLFGYGIGAVLGNLVGGRLADRALLPALVGLLAALAAVLLVAWALATAPLPAAVLLVLLGGLAFAIIPGMQTQVLATAERAPTLAVAVNAAGFQVAVAVAGWLGGAITDGVGPRAIYPVAALLTLLGLAVAVRSMVRTGAAPTVPPRRSSPPGPGTR